MNKKIMIVDDAIFMRWIIRKILEDGGYEDVIEAQNGEEALELFREQKPDLILLDITMPGKSGIEVLEEIQAEEPGSTVIMCSAVGQEMMIRRALEAGAADFVVKPFKNEELLKVIEYHYQR